ncbi:MAG: hypothetical protein GXP30_08950 [Verrucomicrobia bacterium]|nr:hypothetical protein [Verrucomicrobiota bacterium]
MKAQITIPSLLLLALCCSTVVSCVTTSSGTASSHSKRRRMSEDQIQIERLHRQSQIAAEPTGDFWIGRRWHTKGTRFWGYVRRPRQPWSQAKLVMLNESQKLAPDRLPESSGVGRSNGFDHNYAYKFWGRLTGDTVYDPNSNLMLPEFKLSRFEQIDTDPGYVFEPWERYKSNTFPPLTPNTQHLYR